MTLSAALRQFVQHRAGGCCEYCRLPLFSQTVPFQIDHIIPRRHDGTDEPDNLCLSCYHCNSYKGYDLTGFDPLTGSITPLFHPRTDTWEMHFALQADMVILGLSPQGRTTANLLHMNTKSRIESRQILAEVGAYPCITPPEPL